MCVILTTVIPISGEDVQISADMLVFLSLLLMFHCARFQIY